MRLLHTADWHISTKHPRYRTLFATLDLLVEKAQEAKPDAICIAGDIMELHPDARDIRVVQYWLSRFAGIAPVVCVRGNHDPEGWYEVLRQTDTLHSTTLVTEPSSFALLKPTGEADEEEICRLDHLGDLMAPDVLGVVHCLPWPAKGWLLSLLKEPCSSEETDQVCQDLLRSILMGFLAAAPAGVPSVLLAHLDVHGARMDSGQPSVGPGMRLGVEDLALAGTNCVMLGHIHARQLVAGCDLIGYAGSPCRLTWGEAGAAAKGGLLWSISAESGLCTAEHIDVPSPRLWTLEAEWTTQVGYMGESSEWAFDGFEPATIPRPEPGDELRFRYRVPEDQRAAAAADTDRLLAAVWHGHRDHVTVEAVTIPTAHARVPEIATETDPVAMFERWIQAEGIDLAPGRAERLRGLIHEAIEVVRS